MLAAGRFRVRAALGRYIFRRGGEFLFASDDQFTVFDFRLDVVEAMTVQVLLDAM